MGLLSKNSAKWNATAHFKPLQKENEALLFKVSSAKKLTEVF